MHFLNLIHWILVLQMWPHVNPIQQVLSRVGTLLMYLYECSFNSVNRYFHQWPTRVSRKYAFLVIWHNVIYSLVKDEWMNANIVYYIILLKGKHIKQNIIYATVTSFAVNALCICTLNRLSPFISTKWLLYLTFYQKLLKAFSITLF